MGSLKASDEPDHGDEEIGETLKRIESTIDYRQWFQLSSNQPTLRFSTNLTYTLIIQIVSLGEITGD